ncbi:hypothetical protein MKW92_015235 [Papaver armeniacum]|nr:hypothetical protein MKW92_015235 [Papaver armeniacum]
MGKPANPLRKTLVKLLVLTFLCYFFYILGSYKKSNRIDDSSYIDDPICPQLNLLIHTKTSSPNLDFEPHHRINTTFDTIDSSFYEFCSANFTDYIPCHNPLREGLFDRKKKFHRERHCPDDEEKTGVVKCLIPVPVGYRTPFQWPESKKFAWFQNVPSKRLVVSKQSQNWVRLEGNRLVFPGGGTSFKFGVKDYVDQIGKFIPLKSGYVRTVLDVGCGVASFGAELSDYNILTMSIAPRDIHEAQVQFALERGLPAMLGILSIHRLPYPSRSFDMAHCARCLVPWTDYGGLYLMEIDRVLRPGGYWVLSGPPINGKSSYKDWDKREKDLEEEQATLEDLAKRLCWKKVAERGSIAIWRKPTNHVHCVQNARFLKSPRFCDDANDPDAGWYKKMEPCITPLPKVKDIKTISGGALEKWSERLNAEPPRIGNGVGKSITVGNFNEDNKNWKGRVSQYAKVINSLSTGKLRNIMDMNAGLGGFAAALSKYPVWVMNVVPSDANVNTLGVIYERGLIGTYMNWCESFSTYPRTYDMIHANGIFSMYMEKCGIVDILFEMHRILRPQGVVIIRDHVDIIVKVQGIAERMKWNCVMYHSENGASHPEKVLYIDNSESLSNSDYAQGVSTT